jgi:hypothetical protein
MNTLEKLKVKPTRDELTFKPIEVKQIEIIFPQQNDPERLISQKIEIIDKQKDAKMNINIDKFFEKLKNSKFNKVVDKKPKKTQVVKKGVSILPPEYWVKIDNTNIINRLPEKKSKVIYKVSSYYMNNREIFIDFINRLFIEYRNEILDDSTNISCDNIGKSSGNFDLLTHQKLVRDYLNLYTPYRGLLLYHGLGSGKTCTSIGISEGMKTSKKVYIMTPASLEANYRVEMKKCGDPLYKLNQCWEWVSTKKNPEAAETLSSILNLPLEYIKSKGGAWLVNITKPPNCNSKNEKDNLLKQSEQNSLNDQINVMIESKYEFIHYNGLRRDKLKKMTNNFENNIFDNSVVIIDEAHNLISRIVNKISKEKEISIDEKTGKREKINKNIALILYEMLMSAQNARIVLLTGTPIINYPNEVGILFNILRGYIKTWEIPLDIKSSQKINKEVLEEMFIKEKNHDFLDYSSSNKILTITRNPFGFENKVDKKNRYKGVTNEPKDVKNEKGAVVLQERGIISDAEFERRIIRILNMNNIEVFNSSIKLIMNKALPDRLDEFSSWFIKDNNVKNDELLKRRIMGLTSYFRSAQEKLLPRYEKIKHFHIIKIPMSDEQFHVYENARAQERKQETSNKKKKGQPTGDGGVYKEPTSTYRIFSRLYCNFIMPKSIGRPLPKEEKVKANDDDIEDIYKEVIKETDKTDDEEREGEIEAEDVINKLADKDYDKRIKRALEELKDNASKYLSPEGLEIYSPKFLNILENIENPENVGLHLVYSQFRTLEGIGIFKMVLEENGFAEFKIKKDVSGIWDIDISEEDKGKPTFALYTGTETAEEKEIVLKIYNGNWDELSPSLSNKLKEISNNNNLGEVIKVFMITASGSEGINLRNTRYVHIMEPYWHPARVEQVVGRARRICSHRELPDELQSVDVFLYLMKFTNEQLLSDASIELKRKDLSKRMYDGNHIPYTSDESLFEISLIKEEISTKLTTAIKEASIDCAIYSKSGSNEQLKCLQFGDVSYDQFSYNPYIKNEQPDLLAKINRKVIEWRGIEYKYLDKIYIFRQIDNNKGYLYDLDSYKRALEVPGVEPVLIGSIEKMSDGNYLFKNLL